MIKLLFDHLTHSTDTLLDASWCLIVDVLMLWRVASSNTSVAGKAPACGRPGKIWEKWYCSWKGYFVLRSCKSLRWREAEKRLLKCWTYISITSSFMSQDFFQHWAVFAWRWMLSRRFSQRLQPCYKDSVTVFPDKFITCGYAESLVAQNCDGMDGMSSWLREKLAIRTLSMTMEPGYGYIFAAVFQSNSAGQQKFFKCCQVSQFSTMPGIDSLFGGREGLIMFDCKWPFLSYL